MKTKVIYLATKLMVAIILIAVLAVKAFAVETLNHTLLYSPDLTQKSIFENSIGSVNELTLTDSKGDIVYHKEGGVDGAEFTKLFDLKLLTDGKYAVMAKNNFTKKELTFELVNGEIKSVKEEVKHKPYVAVEDDVLKISFLNTKENEIKFALFSSGDEVYTHYLGNNFAINAGYLLSRLDYGTYQVELTAGDETFSYTFEK